MAFLNGWQYRKKITITGATGAGTDYVVLLKVGESSGSTDYDFHLEGLSENFPSNKNDGGDLRFTASDETTLLDFWVEKVEGTAPNRVAYVWVKVSENLDNNVNIYCYFGNSGASNASNGDDTFSFFDDFDTLPTDLETNNATVEVVTIDGVDALHIYRSSGEGKAKFTRNSFSARNGDLILFGKAKTDPDAHDVELGWIKTDGALSDDPYGPWNISNPGANLNRYFVHRYEDATGDKMNYSQLANTWYFFEFYINGNNLKSRHWKTIESKPTSWTYETIHALSAINYYVLLGCYNEVWFDYVFVRKYADPEPAFSSAGAIESISRHRGVIAIM